MPKFIVHAANDAKLNYIADRSTREVLCSDFPSTHTEAATTFALADVTVDTSHFTVTDGDISGRKLVVAEQNGVPVDTTGEGDHVALINDTASQLLLVTELGTPKNVTQGQLVKFEGFEWEDQDPA